VVLSNGNVQVSASRHLELEAAGDIRMAAGGSIFVKARRHIELSATAGGLILHSFAFFRALCEKGSLWLRSDADPADTAPKSDGMPEPEILDSAILIESARGRTALRSEKQISLTVDGAPAESEDLAEDTADIVLATRGSVRARAGRHVILGSVRDLITSSRAWVSKASKWYGDFGDLAWDRFFLSPKGGLLQVDRLDTKVLRAEIGIEGPEQGPIPVEDARVSVGPHHNHIRILKEDAIQWRVEEEPSEEAQASIDFGSQARSLPISPWEKGAQNANWGFMKDTVYYWDAREERRGALVQSLTQQYITYDAPALWGGTDHYEEWNWKADRLTITKRVGENKLGFGGNATQYRAGNGGNAEDLHKPSNKAPGSLGYEKPEWTTNVVTFRILKQS
jgi:hypothetical protein